MKELGKEEITKMEYGNGFIKFYNCFMEKGEYKLTPREWYFYSLLAARWSPFLGMCETTVTAISNVQTVFQDKSKPTRDKTNTWEQIKSLETRGIIKILDDNILVGSRYNYDHVIKVSFNDFGDGFELIKPELYYASDDPIEIYFLCVISRFKTKGFSHTYESLSELLACSESNINDLVKDMKKKKMITYEQGKRSRSKDGTYTRKANTYYLYKEIVDDEVDIIEEFVDEINVGDIVENSMTIFGKITLKELLRKKEHSNWGKKVIKNGKEVGAKIVENDINLLLTFEDLNIENVFYTKYLGVVNAWIKNEDKDTVDIENWISNYHNMIIEKKDDWEKKRKEESIVNAIIINGEIIILTKDDVDHVDFNLADEIYYFENDKPERGNFKYLAGSDGVTDEMKISATREYKKVVKSGKKLTMKMINEIREKVKHSK